MCGIFASVCHGAAVYASSTLRRRLCQRGPDHDETIQRTIHAEETKDSGVTSLTFTSTVLALRGGGITPQPLANAQTGAVLCWNGEAWSAHGQAIAGNDAAAVFGLLADADSVDAVLDVFRGIQGPFAFIYWDGSHHLIFGRDRLGRRSLLARDDREKFFLASIADSTDSSWKEIEADGLYVMNLVGGVDPAPETLDMSLATRHDWVPGGTDQLASNIAVFNATLPSENIPLQAASNSVQALRQHLVDSLSRRVQNVPHSPLCAEQTDTRIAVLFSGGLDCTVLARLSSDLVPADQGIDLLNVAFENPRVVSAALALRARQMAGVPEQDGYDAYESCPDRITGRASFRDLVNAFPRRKWRFVAVNVPYAENINHRTEILELMHPHNTEMDLSIASALYFASRGHGWAQQSPETEAEFYMPTARVLLSGLGADELFGGYGRHAAAFNAHGFAGLMGEIRLDVGRIGKRNLGRDDRVLSHWGREVRFPYLDEELFKWALERPLWEKCDFANPTTEASGLPPDKKVLRLLAEELGMTAVAREKKRAIQFGARTAKMESGKTKGTALIGH